MVYDEDKKMVNLEEKEIRGINFKLIRAVVISTATIVFTVSFNYFALKSAIEKYRIEGASENRLTDLRLKTIEINLSFLQKQIDAIYIRMDEKNKIN